MDSQRYAFKLDIESPCDVPSSDLILFFHRLIQAGGLSSSAAGAPPWETIIDVADYSHVPDGPGVMLICHEAHYSTDHEAGRFGLRCATKRGASGGARERIQRVIGKILRLAAEMVGHEVLGGRVRFNTSSAVLRIEDRLLAPNDEATFSAVAPVLAEVISDVWGAPPVLVRAGSPKECFQIEISTPVRPPVADLLRRMGSGR